MERARLREEDIATRIGRREFIAAGGAAAAWPLAARAQTPAVVRRVGILSAFVPGASSSQRLTGIFSQGLQELGWTDGRNLRIEQRWSGGDNERLRSDAHELMNLPVDVILAITTPAVTMLKQEGTRIPVVFVGVSDPVGSGFVNSLPRPGGNITGFTNLEGSLSGKWLELLKEVVPRLTHAGFMFNPESAPFAEYYLRAFETAAATASVRAVAMPVHDAGDVDKMVAELKALPVGGLVVMPDNFNTVNRARIIELAMRERLPVVYPSGIAARQGGLIGYGIDDAVSVRGAVTYVDRILRGAKPADLPVQAPTTFELVINLKTARALGLDVPATLIARADEVIE